MREQYNELKIESMAVLSTSVVNDVLTKQIINALIPSNKDQFYSRYDINKLRDAYFYYDKLNNCSRYKQYYSILETLLSLCGISIKKYPLFTEAHKWQIAIKTLNCYAELNHNGGLFDEEFGMEKQRDRVKAVKELRKYGLGAEICNNDIELSNIDRVTN